MLAGCQCEICTAARRRNQNRTTPIETFSERAERLAREERRIATNIYDAFAEEAGLTADQMQDDFAIEPAEPEPAPTYRECERCGRANYADQMATVAGRTVNICRACMRNVRANSARVHRTGRRFGVEIEFELSEERTTYDGLTWEPCPVPADEIVEALECAGIACYNNGYTHAVETDAWKIVPDGSVAYGHELVSPPLTWEQRDQVATVCRVLRNLGAEATDVCGVHVHHEIPDLNLTAIKQLVRAWHSMRNVTKSLIDRSRHHSQWCADLTSSDLHRFENATYVNACGRVYDRYRSLNFDPFLRYGTVEMRQHEGTLNDQRILAWIAYGQAFIEAARAGKVPMCVEQPSTPECHGVLDALPIKCEESRAMLKRRVALPAMMTENEPSDWDDYDEDY